MKPKILFITNKRSIPYLSGKETNKISYMKLSSGLVNSVLFVVDMLKHEGLDASYVQVNDANDIDREVHKHRPTHVILEALWVTPTKLKELVRLHKNVKWVIRLHSETPFLANEGIAMEWLFEYSKISHNVSISANSERIVKELSDMLKHPVAHLPNYYKVDKAKKCFVHPRFNEVFVFNRKHLRNLDVINIGCFGAIRPMKNQLIQAMAAIKFSDIVNKKIKFHINVNREEMNGEPVLKNIRNLFKNTGHTLVEHAWMDHDDFVKIVRSMDIGMQVSFSETYNIVTADLINAGIPVIVSKEIKFVDDTCKVNPTSYREIVEDLLFLYLKRQLNTLIEINKRLLRESSDHSIKEWKRFFS